MNNQVKEFFDKIAINYVHDDNEIIKYLLDCLYLDKCNKIMDLGCGKGIISDKLQKKSKGDIIAVDLSNKMIEMAKANISNPKVNFINEDFYEFKDKDYDAIICFDAFPHFLDIEGFVNKANQLLKKDGLLAIIHDCGRNELNSHHQTHALHVSRKLETPEIEFEAFKKYFKPIELSESDKFYKMIMIKKQMQEDASN